MYKERLITDKIKRFAEYFPAVVVTGARQVGKSSLVKKVFAETADYVLFDPIIDIEFARSDPELFLANHKRPLILDEIQYCPQLIPVIKRLIDRDKTAGQFILTGSQQWSVMKSVSESLAGRAVILELAGFSLQEQACQAEVKPWLLRWIEDVEGFIVSPKQRLNVPNQLYETLWRGAMPEATLMPFDLVQNYYSSYVTTYIERDARQFGDVSDWQLFSRFVRLAATMTSQEINHSQLGRELGISNKTSSAWLDILKATFQWFELPAYCGNTIKRLTSKPKGYICDTGITCNAQAISSPQALGGHPLFGSLFETAVVSEIKKQLSLLSPSPNIYHWRTQRGAEVDILVETNGVFYPIEVKASSRPGKSDTSGIKAFRETFPNLNIAKGLIVCPCETFSQISADDYVMPWDIA